MAHPIIPELPKKTEKRVKIKMPDMTGKFGISLNFGKKELFFGVAIANIEIETVVKKKKVKAFTPKGRAVFVNT